ncbi:hypothetical protein F4813DRAFT_32127 [Daldinia decipiens]|uniref:uncharacterized protein n=1 Tax=Daldinia decipiens TaxID=326647 RepID=UPI0020C28181|nr:uncharacterized protein F4813DRAFT_32127 [Daldinia decipiens]KAI1658872.1 hypothetical protein F4813DRAFT_32127 [Daldinia decipiens]
MSQTRQINKTIKTLSLENYVPDGGQVRDDIAPKLGTITRSEFEVEFQLIYEVHGDYNKGDKDNASLLVIRILPKAHNHTRQFGWFKVTLTIAQDWTDSSKESEDDESIPLIESIEPASRGTQFVDVFTTNETPERAVKGSIQAQIYGATAGLEGSNTSKSEFKTHHLLKVKSGTQRTVKALSRKKVNRVWWTLEAAKKEDGIGDSFTVALLIKRPRGSKFRLEAHTDGEIGTFKEKVKYVATGFWSKNEDKLLDIFGPAGNIKDQKIPKDIDVHNLHAASTENIMQRIEEVGLHLPEQRRPVRFEEEITTINSELEDCGPLDMQTALEPVEVSSNSDRDNDISHVATKETGTEKSGYQRIRESKGSLLGENPPMTTPFSIARVERLHKMAALYERLAELHREEA